MKTSGYLRMLTADSILFDILDYVARGAVLVVIFMFRWLFVLDTKFKLLEQNHAHEKQLREDEAERRDEQRKEILASIESHSKALQKHNSDVLTAIGEVREKIAERG